MRSSPEGASGREFGSADLALSPRYVTRRRHLNRTPKAKGALAGCVLTAIIGMITVVWYAVGGQLDADELNEEVHREMAAKAAAGGGLLKRGFKAVTGKKGGAAE